MILAVRAVAPVSTSRCSPYPEYWTDPYRCNPYRCDPYRCDPYRCNPYR